MRYFVVLREEEKRRPYIVAETVRETGDDVGDRELSLAAGIAGTRARILTERELLAEPEGRAAMDAWVGTNDSVFEAESLLLEAQTDGGRDRVPLSIVRSAPELMRILGRRPAGSGDSLHEQEAEG